MFIGRDRELAKLNQLYQSNQFEMPVIYGRRRVGKTRLISEFIRDKPAIYVQARRTNAKTNLSMVSHAILAHATGEIAGEYASFDAAFDALASIASQERLIFVLDEFPYLAQSFPEISSLLQEKIDHLFKPETKLMLILCGSSLSFMEEQVLGYESPLYGRRTAQFKIEPFDFFTALRYWPNMNPQDAAICYGFTGGVPAYMEKVDPSASIRENIERLFLNPDGYLYEEPANLLLQECRSPDQYDAIVQAIASGRSRLNEIASTAGIPESNTRTYLTKLMSLGIVKQEKPFGEPNARKAIYCLADQMFKFWYRFVPQYASLIQNGMGDLAYERLSGRINAHMGSVFEEMCRQYLYIAARQGKLPLLPVNVGRWWGTDSRTRTQEEIDLIADEGNQSAALFAECKWRNEPVGADVLDTLIYRSELFRYQEKHYMIFAKNGFTSGCREKAALIPNAQLVTFEEMCETAKG